MYFLAHNVQEILICLEEITEYILGVIFHHFKRSFTYLLSPEIRMLVIPKIFRDFHPVISLISERKYSQVGQTYPPSSITFCDWSNKFYVLIGIYLGEPYNLPCRTAKVLIGNGNKMERVSQTGCFFFSYSQNSLDLFCNQSVMALVQQSFLDRKLCWYQISDSSLI